MTLFTCSIDVLVLSVASAELLPFQEILLREVGGSIPCFGKNAKNFRVFRQVKAIDFFSKYNFVGSKNHSKLALF